MVQGLGLRVGGLGDGLGAAGSRNCSLGSEVYSLPLQQLRFKLSY